MNAQKSDCAAQRGKKNPSVFVGPKKRRRFFASYDAWKKSSKNPQMVVSE